MNTSDIGSFLECSICLESLDEKHKVLPCQHTFCLTCLQDIHRKQEGKLLCPECRTPCSVSPNRLPSNVILNRILEGIKNSSSSSSSNQSTPQPQNTSMYNCLLPKNPSCESHGPSDKRRIPVLGPQVYKSLYDYAPKKRDELELQKGNYYIVSEKCLDGWFKGSSLTTLQTGFFPGNFVVRATLSEANKAPGEDLIDFSNESLFSTTKTIVPPNITLSHHTPSTQTFGSHNRYECISAFPACSNYELNLREGDVVVLITKRKDGWCKGSLETSGKVGLFPASFVKKI